MPEVGRVSKRVFEGFMKYREQQYSIQVQLFDKKIQSCK